MASCKLAEKVINDVGKPKNDPEFTISNEVHVWPNLPLYQTDNTSCTATSLCSFSSMYKFFLKKTFFLREKENLLMVLSIIAYALTSLCLIFVNKTLFTHLFKYPIFGSFFQQIIGFILYNIIALPSLFSKNKENFFFKFIYFDRKTAQLILPLSVLFVGMLGFANACLQYVQVSTYQVARSLTTIFVLCFSVVFLNEKLSIPAVIACFFISIGFIIGGLDSATLSAMGLVTGCCASFFQAGYVVLLKQKLKCVHNDQNIILYYNLLLSSIIFVPAIFVAGEGGCFTSVPSDLFGTSTPLNLILMILSAVLTFCFSLASYICVRTTTPVTYNVVGSTKACFQSVIGIIVLQEVWTIQSLSGIILVLFGSYWYSHSKINANFSNRIDSIDKQKYSCTGVTSEKI